MIRSLVGIGAASMLLCPVHLDAQEHPAVIEARTALDSLEHARAVDAALRALTTEGLSRSDRILAWDALAYSYAAMDSVTLAINAFQELIVLDPDREPDPLMIAPAITSLYSQALGQVLVVRRTGMDTARYVAGQDNVQVRFELSQRASVDIRVIGNGVNVIADSGTWAGPVTWFWSGLDENGEPFPAGSYQLLITARALREVYPGVLPFTIAHTPVDTVEHLTSLPGFEERPEMVRPPRNWMPLALSGVAAGITTGAVFATQSDASNNLTPYGLITINLGVLATGLAVSLRQPELQPVEANIAFNALLQQQLDTENANRATTNEERRRQVVLTIMPVRQENP